METTYSLELSFAELGWLAGAFGMARLPFMLPGSFTEDDGRRSLRQRGLIQPAEKGGWQVDPFAALALQWMAEARHYWVFEQYRPGVTRPMQIPLFMQNGAALLVLPSMDEKRVVACQDVASALMEWRLAIRLPFSSGSGELVVWDVPQPLTIIRANWKSPDLAQKMASPEFLQWASSLEWAGEWAVVNDDQRSTRFVLAVKGNSIWAGRYAPGRPGEFILREFHQDELKGIFL